MSPAGPTAASGSESPPAGLRGAGLAALGRGRVENAGRAGASAWCRGTKEGERAGRSLIARRNINVFGWENRMKEIMSNNNTTNISQARKAVEQLKMEAYMDRIKVSKAAADLLAYCDAHIGEDPLIIPVPASENPFREKKFFCTIL
ncbi:guanine nucleotide-binding protein G(I)/G(S)/G(O) subunit gamma-4 isoform X2 [Caretta caretta]|uniref:guanine nucleotide-binding protein G(I)/G(S)/G(O) subunit gamma-4 isoform X2 n=1 Tax=Caretta caretta TaxID=8467 RepID=UPI0020961F76|nr:guanine nucleotide-binding protein G(I)/G(S)/G(O) subunit gamma-4 isoform X2 [Caretta caretta]